MSALELLQIMVYFGVLIASVTLLGGYMAKYSAVNKHCSRPYCARLRDLYIV
jgi:hypothetical protein